MERKSDVNTELRKFLLFNRKYAKDESNPKIFEYASTALNILRSLPASRFAILDYFISVFEEATSVYIKVEPAAKPNASAADSQAAHGQLIDACNSAIDEFTRCIQELLDHNPIAWTDVLFSWCIETFVRCFDVASGGSRQSNQQTSSSSATGNKSASVSSVRCLRTVLDLLVTTLRCIDEQLRDATLFEKSLERLFAVASNSPTAFDALVTHVGSQFGDQLVDRAMMLTLKDFEWPTTTEVRSTDSRRFASLFAILNSDRQAATIRRLVRAILFGVKTAEEDKSQTGLASEALAEFVQHRLCLPFIGHLAALNDSVCAAFSEQLFSALMPLETSESYASLRSRFNSWRLSPRETDALFSMAVHFLVRSIALTDRFELLRFLLDAASSRQIEVHRVANRFLVELCMALERTRDVALLNISDALAEVAAGGGKSRPKAKSSRHDTNAKAIQVFLRALGESQFVVELLRILLNDAEVFYADATLTKTQKEAERRRFVYAMTITLNAVANSSRATDSRRLAAASLRFIVTHGDSTRSDAAHWRLFAHMYSELRSRSDALRAPHESALLRIALCTGLLSGSDLPTLDAAAPSSNRLLSNLISVATFLLEHERTIDDAELLHAVAHCARCVLLRVSLDRTNVSRVCDSLELLIRALETYVSGYDSGRPVRLHLFDASELHRLSEALVRIANRAFLLGNASERQTAVMSRLCAAFRLINTIARVHIQPTLVFALLNNVYLSNRQLFDDSVYHLSSDAATATSWMDDAAFDYSIVDAFRSSNERSTAFDKHRKRAYDGCFKRDSEAASRRRNRSWLMSCIAAVADDDRGVELLSALLCDALLGDRTCLFVNAPMALGWTDECLAAPSKYTLESDLDVRRQLDAETVRALFELISRRRFSLLAALPLVHAGLNVAITLFESTALQNVTEMTAELKLAQFLVECLIRNGLLAPPLTRSVQLLSRVLPGEVGAILRCVRDFLRDKRRALYEARSQRGTVQSAGTAVEQMDTRKYKDVLQVIVQSHIDQLGHLFHEYL